jgi:alkylhydroperoxidase family enzyme
MANSLKGLFAEFKEITSPKEVVRTVEISLDDVYRIEVYERHEDLRGLGLPFGTDVYVQLYLPTTKELGNRPVWVRGIQLQSEHYADADTALRARLRELVDRAAARTSSLNN